MKKDMFDALNYDYGDLDYDILGLEDNQSLKSNTTANYIDNKEIWFELKKVDVV